MKQLVTAIASGARCLAWFLVVVWCVLPPLYVGVVAVKAAAVSSKNASGKKVAAPAPPSYPDRDKDEELPAAPGLADVLIGAGLGLMLFAWSVWCEAGCVCAMGAEKAILAAVTLFEAAGPYVNQLTGR